MRRFIALALVLLFSLQSTASASPVIAARTLQPVVAAIQQSYIFALLVGQGDRYAFMHPVPPPIPRVRPNYSRPDISKARFIRPIARYGAPVRAPRMLRADEFSMRVPQDRLAMRGLHSNTRMGIESPVNFGCISMTCPGTATVAKARNMLTGVGGGAYPTPVPTPAPTPTPGTFTVSVAAGASSNTLVASGQLTCSGLAGAGCVQAPAVTLSQGTCANVATLSVQSQAVTSSTVQRFVVVQGTAPGRCAATASLSNGGYDTFNVTTVASTPTSLPGPTATPVPTPGPTLGPATTGMNRWWTFTTTRIPGVGDAKVNVANGNLIIQPAADVDVPERGLDLVFQRTYNSQSGHDAMGSDHAPVSVFGNGWTNTFDAHMAYNATSNTLSVYDVDGARYDYVPNPNLDSSAPVSPVNSPWLPPPGMQGTTLASDGGCGYFWTKKNGTVYYFWAPVATGCVNSTNAAYMGRLYEILARNHNNNIVLKYSWANGDASTAKNLTTIVALHSDGDSLTLSFGSSGDLGYSELTSITRPDGQVVSFFYDANRQGDLDEVTFPVNATDDNTQTAQITQAAEDYWYDWNVYHQMTEVASPRYMYSSRANVSPVDGAYLTFAYDANSRISTINHYANVNFTPNDGTNAALHSEAGAPATGVSAWRQETFSFGGAQGAYSGVTAIADSQGHSGQYAWDTSGRVQVAWAFNGGASLKTQTAWNANNDVTAIVDSRNNETDFGYDSNGNLKYVQEPQVSSGSFGTGRPVTRFNFDSYNNLISVCDAEYVWTSGVQSCQPGSGATWYSYDRSDTSELYGKLTDIYTPLGYHRHIAYDTTAGRDFGLPISITSPTVIQQMDGSQRQPSVSLTYNPNGTLASYSNGRGTWKYSSYDKMNAPQVITDPMSVSSYICYNVDGSVSAKATARQFSLSGNVACGSVSQRYTYDADGALIAETRPIDASTTSKTTRWYDGEDRLVEVLLPVDTHVNPVNGVGQPDPTRYIYDVSPAGTSLPVQGANIAVQGYGELYKTQLCVVLNNAPPCQWLDTRGASFDALGRVVKQVRYIPQMPGSAPAPSITSFTYDTPGDEGLLASKLDPLGYTTTYSYDTEGRIAGISFQSPNTPSRQYQYDPDGRIASITSSQYGQESFLYDQDGRLTQKREAAAIPTASTIDYDYYPDGLRSDVRLVSGPTLPASGQTLLRYAYENDGLPTWLASQWGGSFTWTYNLSGQELTQTDPATGTSAGTVTLNARSVTYNAYGEPDTITLPGARLYKNFARDAQGKITSYTATDSTGASASFFMAYDVRNELIGTSLGTAPTKLNSSYYGYLGTSEASDPRTGAFMSTPVSSACPNGYGGSENATYDNAGRLSGYSITCPSGTTSLESFTYDGENHALSDRCPQYYPWDFNGNPVDPLGCRQADSTYTWAPDGQMATISQTNNASTVASSLHWDAGQLLFATDANPGDLTTITQQNIAGLGIWTNASQTETVFDRGFDPSTVSQHTSSAADTWIGGPLQTRYSADNGYSVSGQFSPIGTFAAAADEKFVSGAIRRFLVRGQVLGEMRSDGYSDTNLSFQGVRAYSVGVGQWTTPDDYVGDAADPTSQRAYLWNGNNPINNADPSGYCYSTHVEGPYGGAYNIDCSQPNTDTGLESVDLGFGDLGGAPTPDEVVGRPNRKRSPDHPCKGAVNGVAPAKSPIDPTLLTNVAVSLGENHVRDQRSAYNFLRQGGILDVQRWNTLPDDPYQDITQWVVGAYLWGARYSLAETIGGSLLYGLEHKTGLGNLAHDAPFWGAAYSWASTNCQ